MPSTYELHGTTATFVLTVSMRPWQESCLMRVDVLRAGSFVVLFPSWGGVFSIDRSLRVALCSSLRFPMFVGFAFFTNFDFFLLEHLARST